MALVFLILIVLVCGLLGLVILIQNPKGGGLAGTFGGFGNQFMGVKQTNDVLEKGTWLFAGILAVLCIVSTLFFSGAPLPRAQKLFKISIPTAATLHR